MRDRRQIWAAISSKSGSDDHHIGDLLLKTFKVLDETLLTFRWPAVIVDRRDGTRYWGMIQQTTMLSDTCLRTWLYRDMLTIKHTPSYITVVAASDDGAILWQNAASMAAFGGGWVRDP